MRRLRVGTRRSALALAQARQVAAALGDAEVVPIATADSARGDKARFVRGIEEALLAGEVDLAVHSAKDVPGEATEGLELVGVPAREDPADVLVGAAGPGELRPGARVGTSSLRRRSQLLALRPDLEVVEVRGNVDTRLRKLAEGEAEALVLAAAGLARLGRSGGGRYRFPASEIVPAPGQGALAIQARSGDGAAAAAAAAITDRAALVELTAERAAVAALGGGCDTPLGVCARYMDGTLAVGGYAGLPDGSEWVRDAVRGDPEQPAALGEALAERMLAAGAREVLERAAAAAREGAA